MTITINGSGTITGASTLATTVASPTFTTPNIDSAQFATVSGTAPIYPCRAWVNFNGTGTVAIRASGNVSSITDNGTGDYTVNFTTALSDANYAAGVNAVRLNDRNTRGNFGYQSTYAGNKTTTILRVYSMSADFTLVDSDMFDVIVFR